MFLFFLEISKKRGPLFSWRYSEWLIPRTLFTNLFFVLHEVLCTVVLCIPQEQVASRVESWMILRSLVSRLCLCPCLWFYSCCHWRSKSLYLSLTSIVFSLLFFHVFLCLPFHCVPDKRRDPSFTVFLLLLLKRGRNFILRTKSSDRSQRKLMPKSIAREKRRFLSRVRIWKASKEGKLCCDGFFFPGV